MTITLNTATLADGIELIDVAMLPLISGGVSSDDVVTTLARRDDRTDPEGGVGS